VYFFSSCEIFRYSVMMYYINNRHAPEICRLSRPIVTRLSVAWLNVTKLDRKRIRFISTPPGIDPSAIICVQNIFCDKLKMPPIYRNTITVIVTQLQGARANFLDAASVASRRPISLGGGAVAEPHFLEITDDVGDIGWSADERRRNEPANIAMSNRFMFVCVHCCSVTNWGSLVNVWNMATLRIAMSNGTPGNATMEIAQIKVDCKMNEYRK